MDDRLNRVAALANQVAYERKGASEYINGAPHIKHASLRKFYGKLVVEVYDYAARFSNPPSVLDLGAGEGSVTLPFLELGARVTAVDISSLQLDTLRDACRKHEIRLEVRCEDINDTLQSPPQRFDIVALNSFLHHIPDYLSIIEKCVGVLSPHGTFFSFQDPLRYDTVGRSSRLFVDIGYFFWRLSKGSKGDVIGGIRRRMRRRRGIYLEDCYKDNAEYHITRNGVDQIAIESLFNRLGFDCRIIPYFSSHNTLFQPVGTMLGIKNTFGVIARRLPIAEQDQGLV